MILLSIALAGALGATLRYVIDGFVQSRLGSDLPWGTFLINVSGSLLLGFVTGLALYHGFPSVPDAFLATGFCGAYTTFSTFGYEAVQLANEHHRLRASGYVLGSVVAGLVAAVSGLALADLSF